MIIGLLILPCVLSVLLLIIRNKIINRIVVCAYSVFFLVFVLLLSADKNFSFFPVFNLVYFAIDDLNILFLIVLGVINCAVAFYNIFYLKHQQMEPLRDTNYSILYLLFVTAMAGVLLSTHLALVWIFIEATTLISAIFIYFEKQKNSVEASWKYIFICSIGISMGFIGIIFLSIGAKSFNSLFFSDLYLNASAISSFWLKLSFAFIIAGFGTKTGFAPLHAWLPDAYSEAPSPISALLSGALIYTVFLAILRFFKLMRLADSASYAQIILMVLGIFSVIVSAAYIFKVKNYKRMIAYSSIENMGMTAIAIAAGPAGAFAALFMVSAQSLGKSTFFLTAGNIYYLFKSKTITDIKGLMDQNRITAWLWLISFIVISGLPPFPSFISKFLIFKTLLESNNYIIAGVLMVFMIILTYGMGKIIFNMSFGKSITPAAPGYKITLAGFLPQFILLGALLSFGTVMPPFIYNIINNAALFLG